MDRLLTALLFLSVPIVAGAVEIRAAQDTWIDGAEIRDLDSGGSRNGKSRILPARDSGPRIALVYFSDLPSSLSPPATLNLRVESVSRPGEVQVRMVQGAWKESSLTFNSKPAIASVILDSRTITAADVGRTVSFDVSAAVTSWIANPQRNFGLALTATATQAEVYFVSREGAVPPALVVNQTPADNEVTVAKSGGDYADPAAAAKNAFSGDNWCVNPSESEPCRMRIGAGVFILTQTLEIPRLVAVIGAGRKMTRLVADTGVEPAVMSSSVLLSDLGILNLQGGRATALFMVNNTSAEAIDSKLERVDLTAIGQNAFAIENFLHHVQATDSVFTAEATLAAIVVPMIKGSALDATGSSLVCRSGNTCTIVSADAGNIRFQTTNATAYGGNVAVGLTGTSTTLLLVDSTIAVDSAGSATGLLAHASGGSASLSNAQVTAQGGSQGTGISWFGGDLGVDDSLVTGTTFAIRQVETLTAISIRGSTLLGQVVLRELNPARDATPLPVSIENSVLRGTAAIRSEGGARYTITNSVLGGQRTFNGSRATCTGVYDAKADRVGDSCQ